MKFLINFKFNMSNQNEIFESWKKKGNGLLVTAIDGNLVFEQFENLTLRAIENFERAPIYDLAKLNDVRCSQINNNKSVAYMHLIRSAEGQNQTKFELYIKKFIQS